MKSTMVVAPERERSFGGKSGTWFRKRKLEDDRTMKASMFNESNVLFPHSIDDHLGNSICNQPETKANCVIGWDDVRCRPVYRENTATRNPTYKDEDSCSPLRTTSTSASTHPERATCDFLRETKATSKKTRSYGGARRPLVNTEEDDGIFNAETSFQDRDRAEPTVGTVAEQGVETFDKPVASPQNDQQHTKQSSNSSVFDFPQHTKQSSNRSASTHAEPATCDFLRETKPISKKIRSYGGAQRQLVNTEDDVGIFSAEPSFQDRSRAEATVGTVAEQSVETFDEPVASPQNDQQHTKQSINSSVFDFPEAGGTNDTCGNNFARDSCKTPSRGPVLAVSAMTSLSVAREFFRRLDKDHALTLTTEPSTSPRKQRRWTGRSSRRDVPTESLELSKEYSDYATACRAFSVSPLTREEYVKNCRSPTLYDGFLDG